MRPPPPITRLRPVLQRLIKDRQFHLALLAGVVTVWALGVLLHPLPPPAWHAPWPFLQLTLLFPILEEILFRGLLQGALARRFPRQLGPLSHANLVTTALFVLAHLFAHSPSWAVAVFIPSLVFGYFRDRYQHLLPAVLLHCFYNSLFFLLFPLPR
jgi:membrane protease YdiL (CAAX protease family)